MSPATTAKRISPKLVVADMEETLTFYREVLGFTLTMQSPEYSIVERDGQTIHFQRAASEEVMNSVRGHTEIYIEVSNIHTLWDHVKTLKDRYRIRDLFDRDYGMTEFHISDPNDCLVFVGEPTSR
ncbi:VOC family protein [Tunturiibacter gelidiferens]|uniref:VOC family protein n=1 Tax=Tunturiibacter gelidiferens TaxID=3069689 RepID=UPI003D9BF52F